MADVSKGKNESKRRALGLNHVSMSFADYLFSCPATAFFAVSG
jgi:hypothetical protein